MIDRRTFTTLLAGGIAAPRTSFAQSCQGQKCVLCERRAGAHASTASTSITPRSSKRDDGIDPGQYPICLAASVEAVFLCRFQQWRPRLVRRSRRQACRERLQDRSRDRRADAAWRNADAALAPDPRQRRHGRRISADRLQRSEQSDRASHQQGRHARRTRQPAGFARHRQIRAPDPRHAGQPAGHPGDARQQRADRQSGESGLDQDLQLQGRRAHKSRGDPARRRHAVRAAASRLSPDAAMGLRLDREPEQALRLQARSGDRSFARADVHQGDAQRSRNQAASSRGPDPRPSQRTLRLSHQPRLRG